MSKIRVGKLYRGREPGRSLRRGRTIRKGDILLVVWVVYTNHDKGTLALLMPDGTVVEHIPFNQADFDSALELVVTET